jgi:hypothetical protein
MVSVSRMHALLVIIAILLLFCRHHNAGSDDNL